MGRVKTRLARDIGCVRATLLYRHLLAATVARLGHDSRWQTILAVAPDHARWSRALPGRVARIGQGGGNLGRRMQRLIEHAPRGPALVIGTDIPHVTPAMIARAFHALAGHDAVFGPATDGGFWLAGLSRARRIARPFAGVRWSSEVALADTLANLGAARVCLVATRADLDTGADLAAHPRLGRRVAGP